VAELHTDFPERFAERRQLWAMWPLGERRALQLEDFWIHKGRVVLKFLGVDSISAAEELTGCEVQIPREERAPLEPGAHYVSDLVGCTVVVDGRQLGPIAEVQFGAGEAPLLVVRTEGREFLLPLAAEFIEELDAGKRTVRLRVPEGLLQLDAPLNAEEKVVQRSQRLRSECASGSRRQK
jgi:16S rRNA processing protein RimM